MSVIMAAHNAEKFIQEAIISVLEQSYQDWELLVINDGSTDQTKNIIQSFDDNRIKYFEQENKGVGAARNVGLKRMKGDFFCFLDADDKLPFFSLEKRINLMLLYPEVSFVEGEIITKDEKLKKVIRVYKPSYKGQPLKELAKLSGRCYFGVTWLIRKVEGLHYHFPEGQTHGEDLRFFLNIAHQGLFDFIEEPVYIYRKHGASAMSNLTGLMNGYFLTLRTIKHLKILSFFELRMLHFKVGKIMLLSFFKRKEIFKGVRAFWLFLSKI